jgi:hypothetical protein
MFNGFFIFLYGPIEISKFLQSTTGDEMSNIYLDFLGVSEGWV